MKLFRNKNTEEMYISLTDSKDNLMDFNGNIITCSIEDYEEVNTKPKKQEFHRLHIVEESFDLREFCYKEWHLKDILYVPVENGYGKEDVAFRVEHISDEKIYFVAVDAVGKSTLKNINSFLDDYLNKMPKDLVTLMCKMEHCVNGNIIRKSKLALLSIKNVSKNAYEIEYNYECNGADDIAFNGMITESESCKNFKEETNWYWLDTPRTYPYVINSEKFWRVNIGGSMGSNREQLGAVVPCYYIPKSISLLTHLRLFHDQDIR